MELEHPLAFTDIPGYTPHISRLLSMMTYVRRTTLQAVEGLNVAQIDYLVRPDGNTIGMLLAHMAAVEDEYFLETVEKVEVADSPALKLGEAGRAALHGQPLEHYLAELKRVRAQTEKGFLELGDEWLHETDMSMGILTSTYFKWFHVFEDEVSHRGQIRLIRRLMNDKTLARNL
jgi:uncharacterized damage-inducible protein DinB